MNTHLKEGRSHSQVRLVLYTTCDISVSEKRNCLQRLASSVRLFRSGQAWNVSHYLLAQNAGPEHDLDGLRQCFDGIVSSGSKLTLSEARNSLLTRWPPETLGERVVVAFPDDDAWYTEKSLDVLAQLLSEWPGRSFLYTADYSSSPTDPSGRYPKRARRSDVIRRASSNGSFFVLAKGDALPRFDPDLGLGTANGGGEDTDVAYRWYRRSRLAFYSSERLIGHRDRDPHFVHQYYRGALVAMSRNVGADPLLAIQVARKLLIGVILARRGQLSWRSLREAFAAAAAGDQRVGGGA